MAQQAKMFCIIIFKQTLPKVMPGPDESVKDDKALHEVKRSSHKRKSSQEPTEKEKKKKKKKKQRTSHEDVEDEVHYPFTLRIQRLLSYPWHKHGYISAPFFHRQFCSRVWFNQTPNATTLLVAMKPLPKMTPVRQ